MPTPQQIFTPGRLLAASSARRISSLRAGPIEPAAALRGVHRFGDAEAEIPQIMTERDGLVPVDRGVEPWIVIGQRIGDDMRGRVSDAVEAWSRPSTEC